MATTEDFEQLSCKELITKLLELFETNQEEEVDECLDLFLFTYNPVCAPLMVLQNQDALKDPVLLEIIMTKVKEIYEPEIFLETANVVSFLEGYEADIATSGIARAVVVSMDRDSGSAKSQTLGCKILANLCHNSAVRDWLVKIKAVDKVMEAIKKHQNNAELVIEACHTLTNLAYLSKVNKEAIVHEHGIEIILDTLTLHKNNVKLINSGLRALRNILNNKMVMELQQHTVTHEVMLAMHFHRPISDIQAHGIWVLIHLMSGNSDIKKHIIEQGALDHILFAMETHKSDRAVLLAGATALALLAKIATNRSIISKQRGIPLLATALQNHRDSAPIQKTVIKALFRLAANKMIRENLIHKTVIQEIIEVMKFHVDNIAIQRAVIICLLQFAKHPPLCAVIQQEAISHIVLAHNKFVDSPHLQKVSTKAVELLVRGGDSDINTLTNQEKEMKGKVQEKEKLIESLSLKKIHLETELEALKEIKENQDPSPPNEELLSKTKKEFAKLTQQRETLLEDIKKAEAQNKTALTELEELKVKLKEEQKLQDLSNKKPEDDPHPKKKADTGGVKKPRSNTPRDTKSSTLPRPGKSDRDKKSAINKPKGKKEHAKSKPDVKKKEDSQDLTVNVIRHSYSGGDISVKNKTKDTTVRIQIDLAEPPPPPPRPGSTNPILIDGKPRLERSASRSLNRHAYTRTQSTSSFNPNTEYIQLKKTSESLTNTLQTKVKEIDDAKEDTRKNEILIQKLNIDLQGAQILIQNLQKEYQTIIEKENSSSSVGSVVKRQQKKIKAFKEQLEQCEAENSELKKLLTSVKKHKKKEILKT